MWHWNSFWARAPGDPPTLVDPKLWQTPWAPDQFFALQARGWEAMLGAAQSWWSMAMPASPLIAPFAPIAPIAQTAPTAPLKAAPPAVKTQAQAAPAKTRRPAAAKRRKAASKRRT